MNSRDLTRGMSVFWPAAALVGRLRYAQKFIVVFLVLMVPMGFVAQAYVNLQRGQIAFSAKERVGVRYMSPLITLTARVADARHRAVVAPTASPVDLRGDIAQMDATDAEIGRVLDTTAT